jgi:hypothetical protein
MKKTRETTTIVASYQTHHSETVRREAENMKDRVRMKRGRTANAEADVEIGNLIPDTGVNLSTPKLWIYISI